MWTLKEERCPVCGALAEHHSNMHQKEQSAPVDVAQACRAEAAKTTRLLGDLQTTLTSNAEEVKRLGAERAERHAELETIGGELKALLQPRLQAAVQKLRESQARRDTARRSLELLERARELEGLLAGATARRPRERADTSFFSLLPKVRWRPKLSSRCLTQSP